MLIDHSGKKNHNPPLQLWYQTTRVGHDKQTERERFHPQNWLNQFSFV